MLAKRFHAEGDLRRDGSVLVRRDALHFGLGQADRSRPASHRPVPLVLSVPAGSRVSADGPLAYVAIMQVGNAQVGI